MDNKPADRCRKKRKRLRLIESWGARRTALPRKLLTTTLRSDLGRGNGPDGLLWKLVCFPITCVIAAFEPDSIFPEPDITAN